MQLFPVGDIEVLDLVPSDDGDLLIHGHAVARILTRGGGLRWAFLDSDWLKQQAAQLAPHATEGRMLHSKVATWQKVQ